MASRTKFLTGPRSPLSHQQITSFVQHQHRLLLDALHRHEPHLGSGHGFADRLRISGIGHSALHIRFHISRRHQPHIVAQGEYFSAPMMGRCTCLHPDQERRQGGEELQNLSAPQLPTGQNLPFSADRMDLKHILRQIDTNGHDILLHGSTPRHGSTTTSLHSYAGAGVVHHITSIYFHPSAM